MRDLCIAFVGSLAILQWAAHVVAEPLLTLTPIANATNSSQPTTPDLLPPDLSPKLQGLKNASTCPGCFLQADFRATLTYPFEVENVTSIVNLVPYITVYPNSTVTSWSTVTPNATVGHNATTTDPARASLSTVLTWEWSGIPLTYPTTYVAYDPLAITGGLPVSTTFMGEKTCQGVVDGLPIPTNPPYSSFVFPQGTISNKTSHKLPAKLVDYLQSIPEIKDIFRDRDMHTCTTTTSNQEFLQLTRPLPDGDGIPKTSVLVLTTQTGSPIVRTVNNPAPVGAQVVPTPQPVNAHTEGGSLTPLVVPGGSGGTGNGGTGNGVTKNQPGNLGNPPTGNAPSSQGAGGIAAAIVSAFVGEGVANNAKPPPPGITPGPSFPPTFSFGGQTVTANSNGAFIIAGTTLTPGGAAATISGSTISIGKSGSGATVAVINGLTSTLAGSGPVLAPLTIGGTTYAPTVSGGSTFYVVDGTTLKPGQVATIDGTTLSLQGDGGALVINGQTSWLPKATGVQMFTGAAVTVRVGWTTAVLAMVACIFARL